MRAIKEESQNPMGSPEEGGVILELELISQKKWVRMNESLPQREKEGNLIGRRNSISDVTSIEVYIHQKENKFSVTGILVRETGGSKLWKIP